MFLSLLTKTKIMTILLEFGCFVFMLGISIPLKVYVPTAIFLCAFYFANEFSAFPILYHAKRTRNCLIITLSLFNLTAFIFKLLPINVSVSFGIIMAIIFNYVRYRVGAIIYERDLYKDKVISKPFDCDDCTKDELIERCQKVFTRDVEYKTERAIKHFILKLPHCDIDNTRPKTSETERNRMRKKLNEPLD